MKWPEIVLASASPRRKELLKYIVEDFKVQTSSVDEKEWENKILQNTIKSFEERTKELVLCLAKAKAESVAEDHPGTLVIGADTVVVLGNRILGKPKDSEEAYQMLRSLAGATHKVQTGAGFLYNGVWKGFVSETKVRFLPWQQEMEQEVEAYIEEGSAMDKAGAYGIQEKAGLWVDGIEGDYFNVVGLPIAPLNRLLHEFLDQA